jgi:hypothetical protein
MLKLMVGVGTRSVNGAELERALRAVYDLYTFEINPISEGEYHTTHFDQIQKRAQHFAERMSHDSEAECYVGVASGIAPIRTLDGTGPVRMDMASLILATKKETWYLNFADAQWQIREKVIRTQSPPESLSRLLIQIHKILQTVQSKA